MAKKSAFIELWKFVLACTCGEKSIYTIAKTKEYAVILCSFCEIEYRLPTIIEIKKTANQLNKELGF